MTLPNVTLTVPTGAGYSLGKVVAPNGTLYTVVAGTITVPASQAGPFIDAGFKVV